MARFDQLATTPARGPKDILRWRLDRLKQGHRPRPFEPTLSPVGNDGSLIRTLPASLTWIGHATFVVRMGGVLLTIDPVWSDRLSGVVPRRVAPGVPFDQLPRPEVVLITHNHRDHLDLPSLVRIGNEAVFVVPLGNAELLHREGLEKVVELDWWQSHRIGNLEITLVPARHWSMRAPWDRNEMLWGGFVLRSPEGASYHSGDTALFDGFAEIGRRAGPLDWAMLPIGAYEPRWFMQPQHMNPEDALQAFLALKAQTFVAMHWGTFRLTDEPMGEPPTRIRALWEEARLPPERLWLMGIGETRPLRRDSPP